MGNYHELSCVIGTYPDLAIFRCFRTANVRNLLIMQAEISLLEHHLASIIRADRVASEPERRDFEKHIIEMINHQDDPNRSAQWKKIKHIQGLLKEYNTALLQLRAVLRLPPANQTNLAALRAWLSDPSHDAGQDFLSGYESRVWDDHRDLTSLVSDGENKDLISKWIDGTLIPWFYHRIGYRFKDRTLPIWEPSLHTSPVQTRLDRYAPSNAIVTTISTVFASTLPSLSIFAFYYVTSPILRLAMITIFTTLFSLIIAVFANAKRSECFASTAAFAAVLVVFVGSTTDSTQTCPSN